MLTLLLPDTSAIPYLDYFPSLDGEVIIVPHVVEEIRRLMLEVYSRLGGVEEALLSKRSRRTCVSNIRKRLRDAISALAQERLSVALFLVEVVSMLIEEERPRGRALNFAKSLLELVERVCRAKASALYCEYVKRLYTEAKNQYEFYKRGAKPRRTDLYSLMTWLRQLTHLLSKPEVLAEVCSAATGTKCRALRHSEVPRPCVELETDEALICIAIGFSRTKNVVAIFRDRDLIRVWQSKRNVFARELDIDNENLQRVSLRRL